MITIVTLNTHLPFLTHDSNPRISLFFVILLPYSIVILAVETPHMIDLTPHQLIVVAMQVVIVGPVG